MGGKADTMEVVVVRRRERRWGRYIVVSMPNKQ